MPGIEEKDVVRTNIKVPVPLHTRIRVYCAKHRMTLQDFMLLAARHLLNVHDGEKGDEESWTRFRVLALERRITVGDYLNELIRDEIKRQGKGGEE